ncbi:MAG: hypothetical protein ACR2PY_09510, partial [Salinispira sp.]
SFAFGGGFSFAGIFASGGWYPTIGGLEVSTDVFYEAIQYVDPRVYQAWDAEKLRDQNNLTAVALTSGISGGIAIIGAIIAATNGDIGYYGTDDEVVFWTGVGMSLGGAFVAGSAWLFRQPAAHVVGANHTKKMAAEYNAVNN